MPTLSIPGPTGWQYNVSARYGKFWLQIIRERTSMPRVRRYITNYGAYGMRGFEGRVQPMNVLEAEDAAWNWHTYDLLQGEPGGFFEISVHSPFNATLYVSVRRLHGGLFEVLEYGDKHACIRGYEGSGRPGDVCKVISDVSSYRESRDIGKPGPRDRYERILDFGVKGVDPEPPIEEVLDKVIVTPPKSKLEIAPEELLAELEKVEAPPERRQGLVGDEEFQKLLDSIK